MNTFKDRLFYKVQCDDVSFIPEHMWLFDLKPASGSISRTVPAGCSKSKSATTKKTVGPVQQVGLRGFIPAL